MLSKIATSINNIGVKEAKARDTLKEIFDPKSETSIAEVYAEQFEMRYDERKVLLSVDSIYEYLELSLDDETEIDVSDELRRKLSRLKSLIERLLGV
jgi:hypothetical protein